MARIVVSLALLLVSTTAHAAGVLTSPPALGSSALTGICAFINTSTTSPVTVRLEIVSNGTAIRVVDNYGPWSPGQGGSVGFFPVGNLYTCRITMLEGRKSWLRASLILYESGGTFRDVVPLQ